MVYSNLEWVKNIIHKEVKKIHEKWAISGLENAFGADEHNEQDNVRSNGENQATVRHRECATSKI